MAASICIRYDLSLWHVQTSGTTQEVSTCARLIKSICPSENSSPNTLVQSHQL